MLSKLALSLYVIVANATFIENDMPQAVPVNVNAESKAQYTAFFHPFESNGKAIADAVELGMKVMKDDKTKDEKAEGLKAKGKTDCGIAEGRRNGEFEIKEKRYDITKSDENEKYEDDDNLTPWLKLLIRSLMIELKKQFVANKQGLSLYGAVQRATGDFWTFFINAVKSFNNLADLLFSPMLAVLQPPLI